MTTTQPPGVKPPGEPVDGECTKVIDDSKLNHEIVCGARAVAEILVRNDYGLFIANLCADHQREHKEFYRNRNRRSRHRRHR